jgi:hypothetical protein
LRKAEGRNCGPPIAPAQEPFIAARANDVLFAFCVAEVRLDAESREKDFAWHPEASFDLLEFVLPPLQAFAATRDAAGRNGFVEIGFERLIELRLPVRRGGRGGVWLKPGEGRVEGRASDPSLCGKRPEGLQKLLEALG